jgi:Protein of unknown function (DUF3303)
MRYMVVERFVQGARPVYERAATEGRILPPGVRYIDSWIGERLDTCFQLMEADDPRLLTEWMESWRDLVAFDEVVPVITSAEAASRALRDAATPGSSPDRR